MTLYAANPFGTTEEKEIGSEFKETANEYKGKLSDPVSDFRTATRLHNPIRCPLKFAAESFFPPVFAITRSVSQAGSKHLTCHA